MYRHTECPSLIMNCIDCRYCAEFTIEDSRPTCQSPAAGTPWTRVLTEGATVCVECQSVAMRSKLGGRCRGHGVLGRQTRWNTATAPGCTGLWTMKTKRRDCSCNPDSKFSFILIWAGLLKQRKLETTWEVNRTPYVVFCVPLISQSVQNIRPLYVTLFS